MVNLWKRIWNSEPVVLVGAFVSAWTALVAFDQADDSWAIPIIVYVIAVPLMAFLTGVVRQNVSPSTTTQ